MSQEKYDIIEQKRNLEQQIILANPNNNSQGHALLDTISKLPPELQADLLNKLISVYAQNEEVRREISRQQSITLNKNIEKKETLVSNPLMIVFACCITIGSAMLAYWLTENAIIFIATLILMGMFTLSIFFSQTKDFLEVIKIIFGNNRSGL